MSGWANPDYDPNWPARLREAEEALTAAEQVRAHTARAHFGGAAHQQAVEQCAAARLARENAWVAQFPTITAYAVWRFCSLPHDDFAVAHDFSAFQSRGEVDIAFARAKRDAEEGTDGSKHQLRTAQPPGLGAFAGNVVSTWRRFGAVDILVSFHEKDGNYHVCLAHRWGELTGSNEIFRASASQLMRESLLLLLPGADVLFSNGAHRLLQHRDLLRQANTLVARFSFYRHLLPGAHQREEFVRVEMGWDGISFIDPDWEAQVYGALPVALREAAAQPPSAPLQIRAE